MENKYSTQIFYMAVFLHIYSVVCDTKYIFTFCSRFRCNTCSTCGEKSDEMWLRELRGQSWRESVHGHGQPICWAICIWLAI